MSNNLYINIARQYAEEKSKCQFTKVGCVAVNENDRIIATGVNGTISGTVNCNELHMARDDHKEFSDKYEIHAEENVILELARSSTTFRKLSIYTTLSPCQVCFKHILGLISKNKSNSITVDKIVYGEKYHRLSDEELTEMKDRAWYHGVFLGSVDEANLHDSLTKEERKEDELQS